MNINESDLNTIQGNRKIIQGQLREILTGNSPSPEKLRTVNTVVRLVGTNVRSAVAEHHYNKDVEKRPKLKPVAFLAGNEPHQRTPEPEQSKPPRAPRTPNAGDTRRRAVMKIVEGISSELTAQPPIEISTMTGISRVQTSATLSQIITTEPHVHRKLRDPAQKQKGFVYWFDRTKVNPEYIEPAK